MAEVEGPRIFICPDLKVMSTDWELESWGSVSVHNKNS